MDGFRQELVENDLRDLDYDQLVLQFGKPDELARPLMEAVDPEEIAKESKRRKKRPFIFVAVVTLVLVLVFAAYVRYVSHHAIIYKISSIEEISNTEE